MAKRDLDKSASRFPNALRRTSAGLEQQRQRILDRAGDPYLGAVELAIHLGCPS